MGETRVERGAIAWKPEMTSLYHSPLASCAVPANVLVHFPTSSSAP